MWLGRFRGEGQNYNKLGVTWVPSHQNGLHFPASETPALGTYSLSLWIMEKCGALEQKKYF